LKKYKKILQLTNTPGADIQTTRGSKYRDAIALLFAHIGR